MFPLRLKALRSEQNISQQELANRLGVSQATIGSYETGERYPRSESLIALCDYFGVSSDYLIGRTNSKDQLHTKSVPVLGVIRAGLPLLAEENWEEQITLSQYEKGADFALRVTGDSMIYAGIRPGDIILMQKAERASNGQIVAAVLQDGDAMATLKYFLDDGWQPVLRAANPRYADQLVTTAHRIIGVYAGLIRIDEPGLRECEDLIALAENLDEDWKKAMTELTGAGWGPKDVVELITVMRRMKK